MKGNLKYQIILQIIVVIWGMTGILGDNIKIDSSGTHQFLAHEAIVSLKIVFYRTGIAVLSLFLIGFFLKKTRTLSVNELLILLGVGICIGLHWFAFFYAIKISTVSIGVVCMTMSTLFTSFLEPIFFKRKVRFSEIVISIVIIIGIVIIFGFEFKYYLGIIFGLLAAFFASLFTVINGRLIQTIPSFKITKYELLGAFLCVSVGLLLFDQWQLELFQISNQNWLYLSILALVCTTFAFMVSVWVMKFVTPFTVSVSINMEPIYTIVIAVLLNPLKEKMTFGFYLGGAIILIAIFTNAYLKKQVRKSEKSIV